MSIIAKRERKREKQKKERDKRKRETKERESLSKMSFRLNGKNTIISFC